MEEFASVSISLSIQAFLPFKDMKASTKRIISILLSAALLLGAIIAYSDMVVPQYDIVNELRGEYQSKVAALDNQRQIVNQVKTLLTEYRSIPDLRSVVSLALPTSEDTAGAFGQLYALAQETNLSIQQFGINNAQASKAAASDKSLIRSVGTAQINIYVVGSYANFKTFLQGVEQNLRVMDLTSLKMQPVSKSNQDLFFFNVSINTYYQS